MLLLQQLGRLVAYLLVHRGHCGGSEEAARTPKLLLQQPGRSKTSHFVQCGHCGGLAKAGSAGWATAHAEACTAHWPKHFPSAW